MRATALARAWAPRLEDAGIDTALLDAQLLVAHACGIARERLLIDDRELTSAEAGHAESLLLRRAQERIPVAYLVGERWFDGLLFEVNEHALVPRPDTELLVELAARLAPERATVIDVGTGSGAVAVALTVRRPDLAVTASDVDDAALDVARANARRRGLLANTATAMAAVAPGTITVRHADLLGDWTGDVVVSNPPYVEDSWRDQAAPELAHEPAHALYAGADGLDVIRRLVAESARAGARLLLIEHGSAQGEAVRALMVAAGFSEPSTEQDLGGRDRVTWARRSPSP